LLFIVSLSPLGLTYPPADFQGLNRFFLRSAWVERQLY